MESRVRELERRVIQQDRAIENLKYRLAQVEQLANRLGGAAGGPPGAGGVGTFYADPGATTIEPGDSAELDVYEVNLSGDVARGPRDVINKYPDETLEDARLILSRNSDGSYTVVGQGCATEGG